MFVKIVLKGSGMNSAQILNIISIFCIVTSGALFFIFAKRKSSKNITADSFLLADQEVSGKQFANTFFASATALGNIIFFIEFHKIDGNMVVNNLETRHLYVKGMDCRVVGRDGARGLRRRWFRR